MNTESTVSTLALDRLRRCAFVWILAASATLLAAQEKDTRGIYEIHGEVTAISVSPDEEIWLTTDKGFTYHTPQIGEDWEFGPVFDARFRHDSRWVNSRWPDAREPSRLKEIIWFNRDTAMMVEGMTYWGRQKKTGFSYTTDGGKTWEYRKKVFRGFYAPGDAHTLPGGYAWRRGGGELYSTSDYGQTWTKLTPRWGNYGRSPSIFMINRHSGYGLMGYNALVKTRDYWRTNEYINTPAFNPYDPKYWGVQWWQQGKIRYWRGNLYLRQNHQWFWTSAERLHWQSLPGLIMDLEVDRENDRLLAIDSNLQARIFTDTSNSEVWQQVPLKRPPVDLAIVNGALFVVDDRYEVYRITQDDFEYDRPYTQKKDITSHSKWNEDRVQDLAVAGRDLYRRDRVDQPWYREQVFEQEILQVEKVKDSLWVALTIDSTYLAYNPLTGVERTFRWSDPLDDFLRAPLTSVQITFRGAPGGRTKYQLFRYVNSDKNGWIIDDLMTNPRQGAYYRRGIPVELDGEAFARALQDASLQQRQQPPTLADFGVDSLDVDSFARMVDRIDQQSVKPFEVRGVDWKRLRNLPEKLDQVDEELMLAVFQPYERGRLGKNRDQTHLEVMVTNQVGDTLHISADRGATSNPGYRKLHFQFRHRYFSCFQEDLTQYVLGVLPQESEVVRREINQALLFRLGDELMEREDGE